MRGLLIIRRLLGVTVGERACVWQQGGRAERLESIYLSVVSSSIGKLGRSVSPGQPTRAGQRADVQQAIKPKNAVRVQAGVVFDQQHGDGVQTQNADAHELTLCVAGQLGCNATALSASNSNSAIVAASVGRGGRWACDIRVCVLGRAGTWPRCIRCVSAAID